MHVVRPASAPKKTPELGGASNGATKAIKEFIAGSFRIRANF